MHTTIARWIEFDSGHRVPNHESKCRHPHGHRYRVNVIVHGPVINDQARADDGMVVDFGVVKQVLMAKVHDVLDHAFIVDQRDTLMLQALAIPATLGLDPWRVVVVPFAPTAENLAAWVFAEIEPTLRSCRLTLEAVEVYETPTSKATVNR